MTLGLGHTQTQWMRLLVGTLLDAGIEHFVVSPGSRSTPIVAALQREGVQLQLCIDERSAGFLAVGWARVTGRPAALVCTSGTAGAHYYPAVIEAAHSALPLLVVTADRPPELQANASAQTIDQHSLFGKYARGFFDLGVPDARLAALRGLRRKLAQAAALTMAPHPGPVHLNVPAYKPLEPEEPASPSEREHATAVAELRGLPAVVVTAGVVTPAPDVLDAVVEQWARAKRPLLFCGPQLNRDRWAPVAEFARRTGWPVLAEITHPLRQELAGDPLLCDAFDLVARARPAHLTPDLVVSVGATATSTAWQDWVVKTPGLRLHAVAPNDFADPLNRLELLVQCAPSALFEALIGRLPLAAPSWTEAWVHGNRAARGTIRDALTPNLGGPMTEADAFAALGETLRDGDLVFLGNSLPIRVAETFLQSRRRYQCASQRGVNGIDGLVAGGVGMALAHPGRTLLVLGDVSALHDLGSLQLVASQRPNLVVCILDNRGGRIFDGLPVARAATDLTPWTTPHDHDLAAVSRAFGLPTWTAATRAELDAALAAAPSVGPSVLVCNVDPGGAQRVYAHLQVSIHRELPS